MNTINNYLNKVSSKSRQNRVSFWDNEFVAIRTSTKNNKKYAGLWFKTTGCFHDRKGGCTICDYSNGKNVSSNDIISFVQEGLSLIKDNCEELLISPSGSMLDENEVPSYTRKKIYEALSNTMHSFFSFETRADSINEDKIKEVKNILGERLKRIYIGVESSNHWILKYCINKNLSLNQILDSYKILQKFNIKAISNILLGIPFLTEKESITDSIESIKWSLLNGSDACCIFPTHIKKDTLGEYMYRLGLFKPPSLWSYIEVLNNFKNEILDNKIEISWYTSLGAYNIIVSPTTCNNCINEVLDLLEKFNQTGSYKYIEKVNEIKCSCKNIWKENLNKSASNDLLFRTIEGYKCLGNKLFDNIWYENNKNEFINIENEFKLYYE